MYQNTDRKFRDYYMLTLTVTLPTGAVAGRNWPLQPNSKQTATSELVPKFSGVRPEVQSHYVAAQTSGEQREIYREKLIPQAELRIAPLLPRTRQTAKTLIPLLSSFRDLLDFEEQYQKELSEHESALAHLESLTGVTLP